tara:strand:- start:377 stop:4021 length:3645 start_codon:yes stop_codon:yes gene_type:complete
MDRAAQIRNEILSKFFKDNSRMPSDKELKDLLDNKPVYSPLTEPMVPEEYALSKAEYTSEDLKTLIKDRNLIDQLLTDLDERIGRVEAVSNKETERLLKKAENFFTDTTENNYETILNQVPDLASEADVAEWYAIAAGVDDMYVEDDGSSSDPTYMHQWISLDSFNVDSSGAGISITPSNTEKLSATLSIGAYSETDTSILQTLSKINPISIIASGLDGVNKGIEIAIPILDKNISTVHLDTNAINCKVLVDGLDLFTKSLDGESTLSIATTVKKELKLILFDSPSQVHVIVKDLSIYTAQASAQGTYTYGQYVTLQVPIRSDYGNVKFKPDEYIPEGTNIEWEWSPSRIKWEPLVKDENGEYPRITWNTETESVTAQQGSADVNGMIRLYRDYIDWGSEEAVKKSYSYNIKVGKGCVLFVTKNIASYQGFNFYLDVKDETGYTLEISNATTNDGVRVLKNIAVSSDDFNVNQEVSENIKMDLPHGIHKIDLQIADSIDLSEKDYSQKTILKVLEEEFGAILNLTLGADRIGREVEVWIQPHGLTDTDHHELLLHEEKEQINRSTMMTDYHIDGVTVNRTETALFAKQLNASTLYDIVAVDLDVYSETLELHSGYELHYYSGDGTEDWLVNPYHTPEGDVTMNESGTAYTPSSAGSILVNNSELASTLVTKKEFIETNGSESNVTFNLSEEPIGGIVTVIAHNRVNNTDLDSTNPTDEDFPTFFPKGRGTDTITASGTASETFTLTYRPTVGYCLINGEIDGYIKTQDNCPIANGTWVNGYCSNSTSITPEDCALEGYCLASEFSDKTACENGGSTWSSTYTWTPYIIATDGATTTYDIGVCSGGSAVGDEDRETCLDMASTTWTDFDIDSKEVVVRGLNGITSDVYISYDYSELQATAFNLTAVENNTISSASDIILLNRVPTVPTAILVMAPGDLVGQNLTATYDTALDKWKIDLANYSASPALAEGDTVTLKYVSNYTKSVSGKELTFSNVPDTSTTRKVYKEIGTTINPTATTTLTMQHPVAFREQPGGNSGPNSNLYMEVNGNYYTGYCVGYETTAGTPDVPQPTDQTTCETQPSGGTAGTWNDLVSNINGNVITMDLSQFAAIDDSTQDIVTVGVTYESYDHNHPWRLEVEYDYYDKHPYTFNYAYNEIVPLTWEDTGINPLVTNGSLRNHFYDISITRTKGDDLYLKAVLTSDGNESPIIRRLRFER